MLGHCKVLFERQDPMKIFITSGNTWVRIDPVRVVTNTFTGETGLALANFLSENNLNIKLASSNEYLTALKANSKFSIDHYKYFEELDAVIKKNIHEFQPDVIIHAAAVSDYRPINESPVKIKSKLDEIDMGKWIPTKKLIKAIRNEYGFTKKLIQFKLETVTTDEELIAVAHKSMLENQSDLCIANRYNALEDVIIVSHEQNKKIKRTELPNHLLKWIQNA